MKQLFELKEKRDQLHKELLQLHVYEPSPDWYLTRRNELEYEIASIEEAIDNIQKAFDSKISNFELICLVVFFSVLTISSIILIFL